MEFFILNYINIYTYILILSIKEYSKKWHDIKQEKDIDDERIFSKETKDNNEK